VSGGEVGEMSGYKEGERPGGVNQWKERGEGKVGEDLEEEFGWEGKEAGCWGCFLSPLENRGELEGHCGE